LNLRIKRGEKIAMLGRVGSGKSSCSSILSRIQTFQGGNIYINDIPITEIDINDLRLDVKCNNNNDTIKINEFKITESLLFDKKYYYAPMRGDLTKTYF
jgi:ABC-type bacteriocin/lantibiotic exporter with double-glycine peptidase domain